MHRRDFIAGAALGAVAAPSWAKSSRLDIADALDAAAARALALDLAPGIGLAVYTRRGGYAQGHGLADRTRGEPATAATAFYIASSTKAFTGLALAILHARGQLDLDRSIGAYAPDAAIPESVRPSEVSFRHLLSHTSGIQNDGLGFRVAYSGEHDPALRWRLLASSTPNANAPLGRFDYTNIGYNIATELTDRKLGVAWQDLLQREVFGPAGMRHASARISVARRRGWSLATPHNIVASGAVVGSYLQKSDQTMQSAGGVILSANDALRWLELMVEDGRVEGRQVVPAAAVRAVQAQAVEPAPRPGEYVAKGYGLGWYIGNRGDDRVLYAFGSFSGFRSHVSFAPDQGVGVAVFVNDASVADPVADALAGLAYDLVARRQGAGARYDAALQAAVQRRGLIKQQIAQRAARPWRLNRPRAAYAGVYANPLWGRLTIAVDADRFEARIGVLHALAEPFTAPESIRTELAPGVGMSIVFDAEGPQPRTLVFQGAKFERVDA